MPPNRRPLRRGQVTCTSLKASLYFRMEKTKTKPCPWRTLPLPLGFGQKGLCKLATSFSHPVLRVAFSAQSRFHPVWVFSLCSHLFWPCGRRKIKSYFGIWFLSTGSSRLSPPIAVSCVRVAWLTASLPANPLLLSPLWRCAPFPSLLERVGQWEACGRRSSGRRGEAGALLLPSLPPGASPAAAAASPWPRLHEDSSFFYFLASVGS